MQNVIKENIVIAFDLWFHGLTVAFRMKKILLKNSFYEIHLINNPYQQIKPRLIKI